MQSSPVPTIPTPKELEAMLIARLDLSDEGARDFLLPQYTLGDVWLFADMEKAVERIKRALDSGEHIGIYADYDCDGIPAAVVLVDLFKALNAAERTHVYIPDRHDEGYGVSTIGIDQLKRVGATLIITVDVGITALEQVRYASENGIDMIVTDHHMMLETLPASYAVVHPMHGTYPNRDLCGAGVAFMVARAFIERYGKDYDIKEGWEKWLLDLVGFATLSDMVPLTGENRTIVTYGLMVMRKTRRVGLQTLFAANMIDPYRLTESDLTFTVAPRLNAASRMATPMLAFELLATDDRARAKEIVTELTRINDERKLLVARIVKEAHAKLDARELPAIVVLGDLTWRPAVLGLVANKLQETYGRSFFVWGESGDGLIKGSCRMISDHHAALLFQALPEGLLLHSGGHQAAGGFAVAKDKIHFLEQGLNAAISVVNHSEDKSIIRDAISAPLAIATVRHLAVIRMFAPYGVGNTEPLFLFKDAIVESAKKFGKAKEHYECVVRDATGSATAFTFFASEALVQAMTVGATVSFTATLEAGWRGGVRLHIKELS